MLSSRHDLVAKRGFGHAVMLAGQGPKTLVSDVTWFKHCSLQVRVMGPQEEWFTCTTSTSRVPGTTLEGGAEWEPDRCCPHLQGS